MQGKCPKSPRLTRHLQLKCGTLLPSMGKQYYITTPIYYVNDVPHVGTTLTTVLADAAARFQRLRGRQVHFLTGTDENAPKVAKTAAERGITPQQLVDEMAANFAECWRKMHIEYDVFIRTTEERHHRTVHKLFRQLRDQGDIYKGHYEGWYCVSCETFWPSSKVGDDQLCLNPECRKPLEWRSEESYFFRLSAYADRLRDYIQQNPAFIEPATRRNETLGLINEGLLDNAISRSDSDWGIPVPDETGTVIYVWFEALINYLTETGWADGGDSYLSLWPPDLQLMGKDILARFHATLWPAMLMALGLPLPERLYGHGWWLFGGEKISKSKGNAVEPLKIVADLQQAANCEQPYAVDALRYYMLREMPTSADANFSIEGLEARYNADLANDLGNMVHRTLSMVHRYLNGIVPQTSLEPAIAEGFRQAVDRTAQAFEEIEFPAGLRAAWEMIRIVNHYYDSRAPWSLAKAGDEAGVAQVLYAGLEAARILAILTAPVMPAVAQAITAQLQLPAMGSWNDAERVNILPAGHRVAEPSPIFPRLQMKSESQSQAPSQLAKVETEPTEHKQMEDWITIDDFKRVKIRVARIVNAEPVPNANKLLKLTVNLGNETRTIVAGIAETYSPEQLVGKQIAMLVNLQPTAIRGIVSEGMLLAADLDGKAILLTPDHEVPEGSVVR